MLVALRSRRHIAPFTPHRPTSLAEALALRQPGFSAFMAGGIDLIDRLKHGHALKHLIRLDGIPGLANITSGPECLGIGATATHAALTENPTIRTLLPDLATLWQTVANPRVRFTGTIGGNVMARRADYDALPALLALGARAQLATSDGSTTDCVALDQLPARHQPLLTSFLVPAPLTLRLFADRSLRPALAVWLGLTIIAGRVAELRLAVSMAHPSPVSVTRPLDIPLAALHANAADIAAETTNQLPAPISDGRASAAYRRRMTQVLTRRILLRACA